MCGVIVFFFFCGGGGECFGNRDFPTAVPDVYAILCLCKERLCQESTQGRSLEPHLNGGDTTTAWGSSGEGSVQAAQRGQVKVQIIKHPAANTPRGGIVPRGSQTDGFCPNTETFSAVHNISVVCLSRLARSPGGLGGRSRIEFIVSPLPRRRHNESHFAAEPPERSFFFPLFLSPRKKKRLLTAMQSKKLCRNPNPTDRLPLRPFVNCLTRFFTEL